MIYEFGDFGLDTSRRHLIRKGEAVALAPKTFDLLLLLLESGGRALTKAELMHSLWPDSFVEEANLSFQISTLRKTLGEDGSKWIETIPRHGYRFTAPVERTGGGPSPPIGSPIEQINGSRRTKVWVAAAVGAVSILVLFVGLWIAGRMLLPLNEAATVMPAVPLTMAPGYQQSPSLSPDGNQVAFSWDGPTSGPSSFARSNSPSSENHDIYIKLAGPGEPIRLTNDPANDEQPAWSPDGQSIAFLRFRSEIHADIFVMPALGGGERKVASVNLQGRSDLSTSAYGWSGNLNWTPDGQWLAFGGAPSDGVVPGIWLVAVNSAQQRRLTTVSPPDFGEWAPTFTRDGRYVAFIRERTLGTSIAYVMPLAQLAPAGPPQRLSTEGASILSLAWKPDGSGLLMSSAGHFGLSRMYSIPFRPGRSAARGDMKLLPFGERARGITVASNGRIVYAAQYRDTNLWRTSVGLKGEQPHVRIAASTLDDQTPDYSPDGKRLAFASTRSGAQEIWLANADGSNPKQVTFTGGPQCSNPRWSPDGRFILISSRREGTADLFLLDAATGELRRITDHPDAELEARWSRDGSTIYFGSNRTGRYEVWSMPAKGGEPVQITRLGGSTATESSDGRYLYYAKYENSPSAVWRVPVGGGKEEPVVDGLSYSLNFVVATHGIFFLATSSGRQQTSLDFFDFASGKRSTLASIGKPYWWGMALSPDEKSLLYSVVDSGGSNLMLVDRFRFD